MAVSVLDKQKISFMPCTEKRTRLLLERGRVVVQRTIPFTIRLKDRQHEESVVQPTGRGGYQRTRLNQCGFPRGYLLRQKAVKGFQTGGMVKAMVTKGKKSSRDLLSLLHPHSAVGWLWVFVDQDSLAERRSGNGAGSACRAIRPWPEGRGFPRN